MNLDSNFSAAVFLLFGLLIGSFLNVVIYRLPQMMFRAWLADASENLASETPEHNLWHLVFQNKKPAPAHMHHVAQEIGEALNEMPAFNLLTPASRCSGCGHQIRWFENIPILSWLFLRGRCSGCKTRISFRYPAVELATGLLFAWCGLAYGLTWTGAAWALFSAVLVTLAMIDWDTKLLPDSITLPFVWAGILASMLGYTQVSLMNSVMGAVIGYMSLWSIYWIFKLLTGKEGMGFGDFKLLAALGAWFGWAGLVPVILISSVVGAVIGLFLKINNRLGESAQIPFGPFLALGGLAAMLFSPATLLRAFGLGV